MNNIRVVNTDLGEGVFKFENGIIDFSVKSNCEKNYSLYLKDESDMHYVGDLKRKNEYLYLVARVFFDVDPDGSEVLIVERKTKADVKQTDEFLDGMWKKHDINRFSEASGLEKKVLENPVFIRMSKEKGGFYVKTEQDGSVLYALEARFGTSEHPMLDVCDYAVWFPKNLKNKKIDSVGYWVVGIDKNKKQYFAVVD